MRRFTISVVTLTILVVAGVAVFVWPTIYRYDVLSGRQVGYYLIKTNRFTGLSYGLTHTGWHELAAPKRSLKAEVPASPEALPGRNKQNDGRVDITDELIQEIESRRERGD